MPAATFMLFKMHHFSDYYALQYKYSKIMSFEFEENHIWGRKSKKIWGSGGKRIKKIELYTPLLTVQITSIKYFFILNLGNIGNF